MCPVCNGRPNCPCCGEEPRRVECAECGGSGKIYFDEEGERITQKEYNDLPKDRRECASCGECGGEGTVEYEYEYDYE